MDEMKSVVDRLSIMSSEVLGFKVKLYSFIFKADLFWDWLLVVQTSMWNLLLILYIFFLIEYILQRNILFMDAGTGQSARAGIWVSCIGLKFVSLRSRNKGLATCRLPVCPLERRQIQSAWLACYCFKGLSGKNPLWQITLD